MRPAADLVIGQVPTVLGWRKELVLVEFRLNGELFEFDAEMARSRLAGRTPEPVRVHWVELDGVRFPVKQALEAVLGVSRTTFTSQMARSQFARLGLPTSGFSTSSGGSGISRRADAATAVAVTAEEAGAAFASLVGFLRSDRLTGRIAAVEHELARADRDTAAVATAAAGLTEEVLRAALIVRREVGRTSDLIHAAVICLALPVILEEGEVIANRPSLGPGNDPSRPFDLETNRRVAEFKVAVWSGGDMTRKRTLVADLVHLALDASGRRPELWVAGQDPISFLKTSTSPTGDLLSRSSPHLRARFTDCYGTSAIPLRVFSAEHASHVQVLDINEILPTVGFSLR